MEIWIIGGIIVALMVYLSTRIKRSAASAFEEETIETDKFEIVKPDGFIYPVKEDSEFAFEAYSKDFGQTDETGKYHQAWATLQIFDDADFAEVCENAEQSVDKILVQSIIFESDKIECFLLKGEKIEKGVETEINHKIVEKDGKVFDFQVSVLKDFQTDYAERAEKLIESFRVK